MAKKKGTEQHPFEWAQIAITRCEELLRGYESLKDAVENAAENLAQEQSPLLRGHSDTPRDVTQDWHRLQQHIAARPADWFDFLPVVASANANYLKVIRGPDWTVSTAVEAVDRWAEEVRDNIAGVLYWLPGPAPVWDFGYFTRRHEELQDCAETIPDIDQLLADCTPERLGELYTLMEHEEVRYNLFLHEQDRRAEEARKKAREIDLLTSLQRNVKVARGNKSPRASNGSPGRQSNPEKNKHADKANKLKSEKKTWKDIADAVNREFKLSRDEQYNHKSMRNLWKFFYPPNPKKKSAVKR